MEFPDVITHKYVLKQESKKECSERGAEGWDEGASALSKKGVNEESPDAKKWGIFQNTKIKSLNFKEFCSLPAKNLEVVNMIVLNADNSFCKTDFKHYHITK